MSKQVIWESLGGVSEAYIMDAMPPSWQASGATPPPRKRARVAEFFFDNGWVAAVLSAVVAIALIVAIVLAGRGEPAVPPVGTTGEGTEDSSSPNETAPTMEETAPSTEETTPSTVETAPPIDDLLLDLPAGSRILSTTEEPMGEHLLRMHVFRVETDPTAAPFLSRGMCLELIDPASGTSMHRSVHRGYITLSVINLSEGMQYGLIEIGRFSDASDKLQAVCSFLDAVPADNTGDSFTLSFTERERAEAPLGADGVTDFDNKDWIRPFGSMITLLRFGSTFDYVHVPATR